MTRKRSAFGTALLLASTVFAAGPTEQTIYSFQGGSNGNTPLASMIADKAGNLYGTTDLGGDSSCPSGCGTVFELSPPAEFGGAWIETVLYRFQGGNDGSYPMAPLVADQAGNLYGTTSAGGTGNCADVESVGCGTVFELVRPSPAGGGDAWTEHVLYSFQGVPSGNGFGDLAGPNGLVFGKSGSLFGLAYSGGHCETGPETPTYCYGGAYELTGPAAAGEAWTEHLIHIFEGPTGGPAGPIFDKSGDLYGTVLWGKYGFGEVFRLEPPNLAHAGWTKVSVHDFQGTDGAFPEPGLAFDSDGNIFGATLGTGDGSRYGDVYELRPGADGTWSVSVVYDFTPYANGYEPNGGLILRGDDHIFGTTGYGGTSDAGVVFELTPPATASITWNYEVLYNFTNGAPAFGLTFGLGGALYGGVPGGGIMTTTCDIPGYALGCGTIFQVAP